MTPEEFMKLADQIHKNFNGTVRLEEDKSGAIDLPQKKVRKYRVIREGMLLQTFELAALHAGRGKWIIESYPFFNAITGPLFKDRKEKYLGIANAMDQLGLKKYGSKHRVLVPDRMRKFAQGLLTADEVGFPDR